MNIKSIIKAGAVFTAGALFALHFMAPVNTPAIPDEPDDEDFEDEDPAFGDCEISLFERMKEFTESTENPHRKAKKEAAAESDAPSYLFAACDGDYHYVDWTAVEREGVVGYRLTLKNENDFGMSIVTIHTAFEVSIPEGVLGKPAVSAEVQAIYKNGTLGAPKVARFTRNKAKPEKAE